MKNALLGLVAWTQNAIAKGEEGQWPGGTLGLILVILLIFCALVFLWVNVDVVKR